MHTRNGRLLTIRGHQGRAPRGSVVTTKPSGTAGTIDQSMGDAECEREGQEWPNHRARRGCSAGGYRCIMAQRSIRAVEAGGLIETTTRQARARNDDGRMWSFSAARPQDERSYTRRASDSAGRRAGGQVSCAVHGAVALQAVCVC